jgi:hypothetical protein
MDFAAKLATFFGPFVPSPTLATGDGKQGFFEGSMT